MIRNKGRCICLLGSLILSIGCVSLPEKTMTPSSSADLRGCYAIFPTEPWESIHRIETTIRGGSSSLLGVTKGEPSERRFQSVLLSPEGFVLFDAERRENGIAVRKAVAPFDSPAFARGVMEDVTLLFLPPVGKPPIWRKESDGTMICKWEGLNDSRTEIKGSMDNGWQILSRDKYGEVIKEVVLNGPFVNGLASRMELRASKPASYRLKITLVQPSP
jgi:hypothetical protein